MGGLTELDLCVLGVIWRSGPLTAYGVRKEFRDSTTAAWSSSAGSIYPAIRRLLAAELVTAGPLQDRRRTQALSITKAGRARLQAWVRALAPELGSATPDPIRTRSHFLTAVPPEDRRRFVEEAKALTHRSLEALEAERATNAADPALALEQIATVGAIIQLRARLAWLDQVIAMLPPDR